jgi:hypothetical protein
MVTDIDLDSESDTARSRDLGDGAVGSHVLRLGLELLIRAQVKVGDRDLGPQPGEALRVGTSETSRRIATFPSNLPMVIFHPSFLPV